MGWSGAVFKVCRIFQLCLRAISLSVWSAQRFLVPANVRKSPEIIGRTYVILSLTLYKNLLHPRPENSVCGDFFRLLNGKNDPSEVPDTLPSFSVEQPFPLTSNLAGPAAKLWVPWKGVVGLGAH